jgi:hypothetical protein
LVTGMAKPTKKQLSEAARVLKTSGTKKQERVDAARVLAASGGGRKGGTNRAKNLTPEQRSEIARLGGQMRQAQRRAERDLKLAQAKVEAFKKGTKTSPTKSMAMRDASRDAGKAGPVKTNARKAAAKDATAKGAAKSGGKRAARKSGARKA